MAEQEEVYLTPEGYEKLKEELEYLRTERRPEVAERIRVAKEAGDVMENAGYDAAKREQAFLEGRIQTLEAMLRDPIIIEPGSSNEAGLGSTVTLVEENGSQPESYQIVGSAEVDPTKGRISNESPLGKALLGHRVGEEVEVKTPNGVLYFRIVGIE